MHGNVQEWCRDWFGVYPYDEVANPKGPPAGSYRAMRGGVWYTARPVIPGVRVASGVPRTTGSNISVFVFA